MLRRFVCFYKKALKSGHITTNITTSRSLFRVLIRLISFFKPDSTLKHTGGRDKNMIESLPDEWFTSYTSFQAKFGLKVLAEVEKNDKERVRNVE